jgi:hypothetical protein
MFSIKRIIKIILKQKNLKEVVDLLHLCVKIVKLKQLILEDLTSVYNSLNSKISKNDEEKEFIKQFEELIKIIKIYCDPNTIKFKLENKTFQAFLSNENYFCPIYTK